MDRHPTDFVRLLFGLAFLAIGGGFIVHQATDRAIDPSWIAAIAFVAVGCAFLAATLLHQSPRPLPRDTPPLDTFSLDLPAHDTPMHDTLTHAGAIDDDTGAGAGADTGADVPPPEPTA